MDRSCRNNPCLDCTDRHPACHGHCEKYIAWRIERDRLKDIIRKEKSAQNTLTDIAIEGMIKIRKRAGKDK